MRWPVVFGATMVAIGAVVAGVGVQGSWVMGDAAGRWAAGGPVDDPSRQWLMVGSAALAVAAFVGLARRLRWAVVVAWVHLMGVLLFVILDARAALADAPATPVAGGGLAEQARLGWGPWCALSGVGVAMLGLMVMLRRELDDTPVPEPKRSRRKAGAAATRAPAKKPVAKRTPAKKTAARKAPAKKAPAKKVSSPRARRPPAQR